MPELPEVETMVRDLRARLMGRVIERVEVSWDRMVRYPDVKSFEQGLSGRRFEKVERRGKHALFSLYGGSVLSVHRGMTGSLFLRPPGSPDDRFVRTRFLLEGGWQLRFDDARKFGRLILFDPERDAITPPWLTLGPEPLHGDLTAKALLPRLARRTAAVKTLLLNQAVIAGVGNIYADETLFLCRIHPQRPGNSLSTAELRRLCRALSEVLEAAIVRRGTTFSTYRDVDGQKGANQHELVVFHRHGERCGRCGTIIQRIVLGGRGTHFCPRCQR